MQDISLKQQGILLKYGVLERENELEDLFMLQGPKQLCAELGISSLNDPDFELIFDYFVINKNFLSRLVKRYINHFKELYEENGPTEIRKILWIDKDKYNAIWRPLHDLVGVAEGSLINYAYNNRFSLNRRFLTFGADVLRDYLEISGKNYDETWTKILDIMLQTSTSGYFNERIFDDALKCFDMSMNLRREHSTARLSAIMR